jgi:hypothetical protein
MLPVQGNVFVLAAPGGNTTVQIGAEGPLVVDTQPAVLSEKVLEAVGRLSRVVRHIVAKRRRPIRRRSRLSKPCYIAVIDVVRAASTCASIMAHLTWNDDAATCRRISQPTPFTPEWSVFSNGEAVQLVHVIVHATATRSSSSADPMSSAPARSSMPADTRASIRREAAASLVSSKV